MEVLEPGRKQKGWTKDFFCTGKGNGGGGCGAKLRVMYGDLYKTHHYDYAGDHDIFVTFACIECGVETDVDYTGPNEDEIPDKAEGLRQNKA